MSLYPSVIDRNSQQDTPNHQDTPDVTQVFLFWSVFLPKLDDHIDWYCHIFYSLSLLRF